MASIFTYDPNPPRVSSPWLRPSESTSSISELHDANVSDDGKSPKVSLLADCGITKLEAEPQDGPTEYKLHLLLRPRRSFSLVSTGRKVSGSAQTKSKIVTTPEPTKSLKNQPSPTQAPSLITRQNRLQHLTTQLLWRLQQSSPYHSSSAANLVVPSLPGTIPKPGFLPKTGNLLPGLEESEGALYEIGVSDDGTFVGLIKDEMDESLLNLRSMAASLGCEVRVLRNVIVGECEWTEKRVDSSIGPARTHVEKLWVSEALVVPSVRRHELNHEPSSDRMSSVSYFSDNRETRDEVPCSDASRTEQLRVSLTGSTTSGKSTLLGTLSTSTLDNGRGKSRLSLLKHRHEIVSGVTSSVAPEIFGYPNRSTEQITKDVVNYGSGNVSSWTDIHNEADGGRLVFMVDSAGHPRYRRTAVRGLLSWAPHWTLCCIAADDDEEMAGKVGATLKSEDILGLAGVDVDLSKAHLELCLKLRLPLVVVVTKFDIASKSGLRQTLAKILSTVKAYGRQPSMISAGRSGHAAQGQALNAIPDNIGEQIDRSLKAHSEGSSYDLVPIIFTSAVTGEGISMVHALLRQLPIPKPQGPRFSNTETDNMVYETPETVFHIDEVFQRTNDFQDPDFVLGGILSHGQLSLGDDLLLGPFACESIDDDGGQAQIIRASSYPGQSLGQINTEYRGSPPMLSRISRGQESVPASPWPDDIWRVVRVVSLRNLRLAVRRLECDQVGTVGVAFVKPITRSLVPRVRRGMVLLPARKYQHTLPSVYGGLVALFDHAQVASISINTSVIAYVASIRAPAKIVRAEMLSPDPNAEGLVDAYDEDTMWGFDESGSDEGGVALSNRSKDTVLREIAVTLRFAAYREWIEPGTKVLIMPEGGERGDKGSLALEGFVGRITEGFV